MSMKRSVNARFAIKSWDEKPYSEGEGLPKLTRQCHEDVHRRH